MTATASINIWNASEKSFEQYGTDDWQFSRLPTLGEYISIEEQDGTEVVLKVMRVVHCPEGNGEVDAELFVLRAEGDDMFSPAGG